MVFVSLLGCTIQCHTWQQRLCWSFARDNGILGSRYWSKVHEKSGVPLNAHIFSSVLVSAVVCIYMGSTTAYNALVTGCITFLVLSYAIPTVFLLMKKRDIVPGPFWLGHWGYLANVVLLCWALFCLVFFSFPFEMPATQENMNYAACATVGVVLYSVVYWFARGKKHYIMRDDEVDVHVVKSHDHSDDV
ncbi:unnamed protein product [Ambrosiozyma monospora]|uniref:Unnamed protein product n=1 Tax=Ambrosiozyma monospora TaxID=43982 RepID=A0ACB5U844_AMBMO|nr:unnamed protein product [Ambrosiozyma monospora]